MRIDKANPYLFSSISHLFWIRLKLKFLRLKLKQKQKLKLKFVRLELKRKLDKTKISCLENS